jgi:antitoxin MazE
LAEEVGLGAGSEVSLTAKDGELVLRPSLPTRLRLSDLLAGITPENIHTSMDTGDAVGIEALGSEQRGTRPDLGLSPKTYNGK